MKLKNLFLILLLFTFAFFKEAHTQEITFTDEINFSDGSATTGVDTSSTFNDIDHYKIASRLAVKKFVDTQVSNRIDTVPSLQYLRLNFVAEDTRLVLVTNEFSGGAFFRVTSGVTDGGVIVQSKDGVLFKRFITNYIDPLWWENGEKDISLVNVQDGINGDVDRINSATVASIREFDRVVIRTQKNYTFTVDKSIWLNGNYIDFKGPFTLKVATPVYSILESFTLGSDIITVQDATLFKVDQRINIYSNSCTGGGQNRVLRIVGITGNTLSLENDLVAPDNGTVSVGDTVQVMVNVFDKAPAGSFNKFVKMDQIDIDGSFDQYTAYHSKDWEVNFLLNLRTSSNANLSNCNFYNYPNEAIFFDRGYLNKCTFKNGGGSGIHFTSELDSVGAKNVFNCSFENTNQNKEVCGGNSEGAITCSNYSNNIKLIGCDFRNIDGYIIATLQTGSDTSLLISQCSGYDTRGVLSVRQTGSDAPKKIEINQSTFINCDHVNLIGSINVTNNLVVSAKLVEDVVIDNCFFLNTRFAFDRVKNVKFTNSTIKVNEATPGFSGWSTLNNGLKALLLFRRSGNIMLNNLLVENDTLWSSTNNVSVYNGILFYVYPDATYTSNMLDFYYQNVSVVNCTIKNFKWGLGTDTNSQYVAKSKRYVGYNYFSNKIYMPRQNHTEYSSTGWGVTVGPGVLAKGNTIYAGFEALTIQPIVAHGLDDVNSQLEGAIVTGNTVLNSTNDRSIMVGQGGGSQHNAIVTNNTLSSPVLDYTSGKSYVANNVIMNDTINILPHLTARVPYEYID